MSASVRDQARLPNGQLERVRWLVLGRSTWIPLVIYVLARLVDFAIIEWASRYQAASTAFADVDASVYFQYARQGSDPGPLDVAMNWDGEYYQLIASDGYGSTGPYTGEEGAYVARRSYFFPPGYPTTVGVLMRLLNTDFAVTAVAVSLVCGAIAMVLIHRLALPHVGELGAACLVALTSTWVSAPIFHTAHSEGLSMALLAGTLLALDRRRPWVAALFVVPLALTRLVTPPLALVVLVLYCTLWRRDRPSLTRRELWGAAVMTALCLSSAFAWTAIQALMGGDVSADRVASYDKVYSGGWVQGLAQMSPVLGILPVLVLGMVSRLVWLRRDFWGVTLSSWAVAYPAYILAATLMVLGVIRYSLLSFPLGLLLVPTPRHSRRTRLVVVAIGCSIGIVLQVLWVRYGLVVHGGQGPQIGL